MALTIPLPLALALAALGVIGAVALSVALIRLRRERDEFSALLVDNYRRYVTDLRESLDRRAEVCRGMSHVIAESTDEMRQEAEAIASQLGEGTRALRDTLRRQLEDRENRLRFDIAPLLGEIRAADEALARVASHLVTAVRAGTADSLRGEIDALKREIAHLEAKHRGEVEALQTRIGELGESAEAERSRLEEVLQGKVDVEKLEQAMHLLSEMRQDVDLLVREFIDETGHAIAEIKPDDEMRMQVEVDELGEKIGIAESELMAAPEELVSSMARWLRLRRVRRAALEWLLANREMKRQLTKIEHSLGGRDLDAILEKIRGLREGEDFEQISTEGMVSADEVERAMRLLSEMRGDVDLLVKGLFDAKGAVIAEIGDSGIERMRGEIEELGERISETEGELMSAPEDLVPSMARWLRLRRVRRRALEWLVANHGLRRHAAELERSLREQGDVQRELDAMLAEFQQMEAKLSTERHACDNLRSENRTLMERVEELETARRSAPSAGLAEHAEGENVETLSEMLGSRIAETAGLREELSALQEKTTADAETIHRLEAELESLGAEYQRLFASKTHRD